jgi:WD40-like Beta Propeller Repeat
VKAAGALVLGVAIVAMSVLMGTRQKKYAPVTLRDRIQLTSTGRVSRPSISPDGKQLAYVVTDCSESRCTYGIEVMDVGGSATRRLIDGATNLALSTWSPDRRALLFTGSLHGRWGSYLISTLGGTPRQVSSEGNARFDASGDSILSGFGARPDSVCWIRIAGLDGVSRDSVRVPGRAGWYAIIGAVPNSPWIIAGVLRSNRSEFVALNRNGREGGRSIHPLGGRPWVRVSADALWSWWPGPLFAGDPHAPLVRIPFDARTGRFAEHSDTVYTGRITAFDVTADGGTVILDEGGTEFSIWTMGLADAFRGAFSEEHRLLRSTTPIDAVLALAGDQLPVRRSRGGPSGDQLSVMPLGGGAETLLPLSGKLNNLSWTLDPNLVATIEETPAGLVFRLIDRRSGATAGTFSAPDSAIGGWAALPGDRWAWFPTGTRTIKVQGRGDRAPKTFALPRWFDEADVLIPGPDGATLAVTGWGPSPVVDTLGVSVLSLRDGTFTPWSSTFAEGGWGRLLPDQSMLLQVRESQETASLYRLRRPGQAERLGTVPRPVDRLSVSIDLKRALIVTRDYHGDAWMYHVVRP